MSVCALEFCSVLPHIADGMTQNRFDDAEITRFFQVIVQKLCCVVQVTAAETRSCQGSVAIRIEDIRPRKRYLSFQFEGLLKMYQKFYSFSSISTMQGTC